VYNESAAGGLCAFASCVSDAYATNQQCKASYHALFNAKQAPFEFKDLKNCEIFSKSSSIHGQPIQENMETNSDTQWLTQWLLVFTSVFGLFVWWLYRRM
jgi:hypothetical protein